MTAAKVQYTHTHKQTNTHTHTHTHTLFWLYIICKLEGWQHEVMGSNGLVTTVTKSRSNRQ